MQRLRELRAQTGKKQKELAEALGIDRTTYAKYESGQNEPSFEMLRALAAYFHVTTDYLLGQEAHAGHEGRLEAFAPVGLALEGLGPHEVADLEAYAKFILHRRKM